MKSEFDAKKFVQLFMAGYVPRSKDEKKFVDKHVAQLHQDVNGNKDDVFKATNVPTHARPPYHGYNKGQDERMYEAVEQIDEISRSSLASYIIRATNDLRQRSFRDGVDSARDGRPSDEVLDRREKKRSRRQRGIGTAAIKLGYRNVSEDAEQIDEASLVAGTKLISKHEGADGHHAEVRYDKYWDDYQVHHFLNGKHLGADPVSHHYGDKKDAEATAKYTTSIRSSDYADGTGPTKRTYGKDPVSEEMTDAQMAKRERIVKSMKKKSATFEKRYGDKAKEVMYATATKMAMEDLDYVNLDMTDEVYALIEEYEEKEDREKKGLKHIESHAKKVREVTKKYPVAQRNESVIDQMIAAMDLDEEIITITFDNGEEAELERDIAESILNIFSDLSEENQLNFEEAISEGIEAFEHALAFIAEAYEGAE